MGREKLDEIRLVGISLPTNTTNKNGQSIKDCGQLWQQFESGNYQEKIPNRIGNEILAVYHEYEGDHTQPFSYFIGCKVEKDSQVPEGMQELILPEGTYMKIKSKGQMPDCIANAWKDIWKGDLARAYRADFEVYGERSKDWQNAEVDIFVSVK